MKEGGSQMEPEQGGQRPAKGAGLFKFLIAGVIVLVILGASGAGKSSFLRAGLLPRLARNDSQFLPLPAIRPERAALTGGSRREDRPPRAGVEAPVRRRLAGRSKDRRGRAAV